jgi:multidrug efflux pump subunit AcrA (membrane-fusion protein)
MRGEVEGECLSLSSIVCCLPAHLAAHRALLSDPFLQVMHQREAVFQKEIERLQALVAEQDSTIAQFGIQMLPSERATVVHNEALVEHSHHHHHHQQQQQQQQQQLSRINIEEFPHNATEQLLGQQREVHDAPVETFDDPEGTFDDPSSFGDPGDFDDPSAIEDGAEFEPEGFDDPGAFMETAESSWGPVTE